MNTKDLMKLFGVRERTVRRWNADGCPYEKKDGKNEYDPIKVIEWRKSRWTKE